MDIFREICTHAELHSCTLYERNTITVPIAIIINAHKQQAKRFGAVIAQPITCMIIVYLLFIVAQISEENNTPMNLRNGPSTEQNIWKWLSVSTV